MLPGSTIGPYRIRRHVGSGATSAVYAATDLAGQPVAVKILHEALTSHLDLALRFFHERRLAALCDHPGVIRIHDAGWLAQGRPYLAMELLGDPLGQHLRGPLPLPTAVAIAAQIAEAAAALHQVSVVHRDLCPANVMFATETARSASPLQQPIQQSIQQPIQSPARPWVNPRIKIVDLGLAKLGGAGGEAPVSTLRTDVLGTMEYRAPEAWVSAKQVDERADVYSLGVLLYQMLAGRRPFEAERESVLMDLHLFAEPPPLCGVPPALWSLIRSMLAKSRTGRPTMSAAAAALRENHRPRENNR